MIHAKTESRTKTDAPKFIISVLNLNPSTPESKLREIFSSEGSIVNLSIVSSTESYTGVALEVTYETEEVMTNVIKKYNNYSLDNNFLKIKIKSTKNVLFLVGIKSSWDSAKATKLIQEQFPKALRVNLKTFYLDFCYQ